MSGEHLPKRLRPNQADRLLSLTMKNPALGKPGAAPLLAAVNQELAIRTCLREQPQHTAPILGLKMPNKFKPACGRLSRLKIQVWDRAIKRLLNLQHHLWLLTTRCRSRNAWLCKSNKLLLLQHHLRHQHLQLLQHQPRLPQRLPPQRRPHPHLLIQAASWIASVIFWVNLMPELHPKKIGDNKAGNKNLGMPNLPQMVGPGELKQKAPHKIHGVQAPSRALQPLIHGVKRPGTQQGKKYLQQKFRHSRRPTNGARQRNRHRTPGVLPNQQLQPGEQSKQRQPTAGTPVKSPRKVPGVLTRQQLQEQNQLGVPRSRKQRQDGALRKKQPQPGAANL